MKDLNFNRDVSKEEIFKQVVDYIQSIDLQIVTMDSSRPWGGFLVIRESLADRFIETFFPEISKEEIHTSNKLSPKILIVAPNKRLSWQYHHRRSEIWKVIGGVAAVSTSLTNEQGPVKELQIGETIKLKQGERHRLIGTEQWGIIAEIWQHTNTQEPSDENDIVRVQDDFGR